MFDSQVEVLRKEGIPCLVPDYPGFGGEPPFEGELTIERITDHIVFQISALGVRSLIPVGVSMGGYIIFDLWRRYRHLLGGLVFVATRAEADTEEGRKARYNLIGRIREEGLAPLIETMLQNQTSPATKKDEGKMRRLRCMMERAHPEGVISALKALAERRDSGDLLPQINLPTLVVAGRDDASITPPDTVRRIAEGIKGAEFVELENSAHLPPFENPEGFNSLLLDFLRKIL
jgi:pimeloyl-ACP methyl ester carboxylesterase